MRLLARLHGVDVPDRTEPASARRSAMVAAVTSTVVFVHLAALGVGGTLLFLRSGEGYSIGETILLAVLAVVGVIAIVRAVRLSRSRR